MLNVNALVKNLTESDGDRFENTEEPVEQRRSEIGIMDEVVGDAVDVPGNAHRIDEADWKHCPQRPDLEKVEHSKEVGAMQERGRYRNNVPARVGKQL